MLTHRYVGVVMGLLMLLWFASGVVMLFVRWPEVTDHERAAGLAPVAWEACCDFGGLPDDRRFERAAVEALAGRPVLRLDGEVFDLATGRRLTGVTSAEARQVAIAYARAHGVAGAAGAAEAVVRDQWTVTGYFNRARPFYLFHFDDPARTAVYVSARDGRVAQAVNRTEKVLSWLGPIPHWLYPAVLRADVKLWTQVVIWTSLAGVFLTVTGLYLGVVAWRPWRDARLTPYRGWMAWHHLGGLAAGLLTLSWVASGLLSVNPWGLLDSDGDARAARVAGAVDVGQLREAVLAAKAAGVAAHRLRAAPLDGRVYLMADGVRLDPLARPALLQAADLAAAAGRLGPVRSGALLAREDQYYRGHHEPVALPVYRVILRDGVRVYIDPGSGEVRRVVDAEAQGFRWAFEGAHRLDFVDGFDRGPGWAAAMTALLFLGGLGVATGVWLGVRRASDDLRRLNRNAPRLG